MAVTFLTNEDKNALFEELLFTSADANLPDPAAKKMGTVVGEYFKGLIWSDGFVWRYAHDNTPAITADAFTTAKVSDGTAVSSKNGDSVFYSYSLAKVLSAIVVESNVTDYAATVTVKEFDGIDGGLSVQVGDVVTVEALLNCSLIYSDNIAARALARHVGYIINPSAATDTQAKQAFLNAMQDMAQVIGMTETSNFVQPHSSLYTTCNDVCKMLIYAYSNCPIINGIWGKLSYEVEVSGANARTWTITSSTTARSREIIPEFMGGKTGSGQNGKEGGYGIVWENKNTGEIYASAILGTLFKNEQRAYNMRQLMNEVYSCEQL